MDKDESKIKGRRLLVNLREKTASKVDEGLGKYGIVSSVAGNLCAVRLTSDTAASGQLLAFAAGFTPQAGDMVTLIPMSGGGYTAMPLTPSSPREEAGHFHDARYAYVSRVSSQSTADTSTNASTVSYVTALTLTIALPTGSWTLAVVGGCGLIHSAASTANILIRSDGVDGSANVLTCPSGGGEYRMCVADLTRTGRTGTVDTLVRYKASAAGTVTANNPWIQVFAYRTS